MNQKILALKSMINSKEIAEEIIESSSPMSDKTRSIFRTMLQVAFHNTEVVDEEAWDILRERLAGWVDAHSPQTYRECR